MPIYEFQCQKCQAIFSLTMKMSDPHPDKCPHCAHDNVTKIMSLTSFQLKGSGWYADGYSGKKPDVTPKAAAEGAAKVEAKGDGKSEGSAPAATADSASTAPAPASTEAAKPAAKETVSSTKKES